MLARAHSLAHLTAQDNCVRMRHRPVACLLRGALGADTSRHLAECAIVRSAVVQLVAGAPSPDVRPPFVVFWRLMDGHGRLGTLADVALAANTAERA